LGCAATLALLFAASPVARAADTDRRTTGAYYEEARRLLRTAAAPSAEIAALVTRAEAAHKLAGDITSCPLTPPEGIPGVTNPQYYFLSEILPAGIAEDSPACGHALACFLGQMVAHQLNPNENPPSPHSDATLVIDRHCAVQQTLVLPNRFVLSGVGIEGRGVLAFDLPDDAVAIGFAPSAGAPLRFVTIRDLNIVGANCCGQIGVQVSNSSFVYLERVRIHGFGFGVLGSTAYSIFIDQSSIHDNGFNVVLGADTTAWRVRDSTFSQSGLVGVSLAASARGNLISGARVESNPFAGIHVQGDQNVIENGWFEGNAIGFGHHGIRVTASADQTRILGNLFSSDDVLDQGADTQICFNTSGNNCFGK
jgi:hypothetical protein